MICHQNKYETLHLPQIHPRGILSTALVVSIRPSQQPLRATQPPCWNVR